MKSEDDNNSKGEVTCIKLIDNYFDDTLVNIGYRRRGKVYN